MGVRNLRAICPNCGGKIHTQPKGLGHFTWANSWTMVQTGTECQHCGAALSGKVGPGNKAIAAEDADLSWWERTKKEAGMGQAEPAEPATIASDAIANDPAAARRAAEWERERQAKLSTMEQVKAAMEQVKQDDSMALCPKEKRAVVIANPTPDVTMFGGKVVRGSCPDCGASIKRKLPK